MHVILLALQFLITTFFLDKLSSCILKNTTFLKLDLFPSLDDGVGDAYHIVSVKTIYPQQLLQRSGLEIREYSHGDLLC
jgi:hypothetical protein